MYNLSNVAWFLLWPCYERREPADCELSQQAISKSNSGRSLAAYEEPDPSKALSLRIPWEHRRIKVECFAWFLKKPKCKCPNWATSMSGLYYSSCQQLLCGWNNYTNLRSTTSVFPDSCFASWQTGWVASLGDLDFWTICDYTYDPEPMFHFESGLNWLTA